MIVPQSTAYQHKRQLILMISILHGEDVGVQYSFHVAHHRGNDEQTKVHGMLTPSSCSKLLLAIEVWNEVQRCEAVRDEGMLTIRYRLATAVLG